MGALPRRNVLKVFLAIGLVGLAFHDAAWGAEADAHARLTMLSDSIVDVAALNFPEGPYGTCINGQTFQQEGLLSYRGYQYSAYFADGGVLCLARRCLPKGNWERIRFEDYQPLRHHDVHNVAVIGICPNDGTIHLSFDHHGSALHYRRSVPDLAANPKDFPWRASLFGSTTAELESGKRIEQVTYPQFVSTPQSKLQLLFRQGGSGNGDWYLAEYDPQAGGWQVLGMLFSRSGQYQNSLSRCAYPNPLRYDCHSRLHVTWCWREAPRSAPIGGLATNHDLHYAYSDDFGRTWKNNDGQCVAVLGGRNVGERKPISINSPGIAVENIRFLWGQMNTTTQCVDDHGQPHVVNWQNPSDAPHASLDMNTWRYRHYWRDVEGRWHDNSLPFVGRKPQIVLDSGENAYVVFCKGADSNYEGRDPGGNLNIAVASPSNGWGNWSIAYEGKTHFVGEPLVDTGRWQKERILSIYIQEFPAKPAAPSPLHVIDYQPVLSQQK